MASGFEYVPIEIEKKRTKIAQYWHIPSFFVSLSLVRIKTNTIWTHWEELPDTTHSCFQL